MFKPCPSFTSKSLSTIHDFVSPCSIKTLVSSRALAVDSRNFPSSNILQFSQKLLISRMFSSEPVNCSSSSLLKNNGFSQTRYQKLIQKCPELLLFNADNCLSPKFEFLYSKGFTRPDLARILSANPDILRRSLDACIIPNFNLVKNVLKVSDDMEVALAFKPFEVIFHASLQSLLAPNLQLLYEHGVPESNALSALVRHSKSLVTHHVRFKSVVEKVKNMGFDPSKFSFMDAIQVFLGMSKSSWDRNFNLYKEWGWSDEEIWSAFRKSPCFMIISERKLKAFMELSAKEMGWKYQHFANRPRLLLSSLEKRVIPRCLVLKYLLSKGLIKENFSIPMALTYTENKFLLKYVNPHQDPHLLKSYAEKRGLPN
ncbi:hypothetical protein DITRI_Ditri08aG0016600 [Diplodiscus trichospermus]